jgi:hypothetical protein
MECSVASFGFENRNFGDEMRGVAVWAWWWGLGPLGSGETFVNDARAAAVNI